VRLALAHDPGRPAEERQWPDVSKSQLESALNQRRSGEAPLGNNVLAHKEELPLVRWLNKMGTVGKPVKSLVELTAKVLLRMSRSREGGQTRLDLMNGSWTLPQIGDAAEAKGAEKAAEETRASL